MDLVLLTGLYLAHSRYSVMNEGTLEKLLLPTAREPLVADGRESFVQEFLVYI